MTKLDGLSLDRLQAELGEASDAKSTKRLMVAIAYKSGVDVETISDRYGIPQSTVYYWLDRFEERPIDAALTDEAKPGRPPKLSDEQFEAVASWLDSSPDELGFDTETWDAETLRDEIHAAFDVDYSTAHVKRTFLD